jgi:phenylalanyl-tRNA synthetase beta chain
VKIVLSWLSELVEVPVGASGLAETLGLRGFEVAEVDERAGVVDFEVTANRPDCQSVLGFAREVSAAFDVPLAARAAAPPDHAPTDDLTRATVVIEDPEGCPRYAGQVVRVRPGPSPAWLADRLTAAGVRPISNIVDVTNYVMLEIGQPMHAFDLDRLAGRAVVVRRARPGETLTTLDGQPRTLTPDILVIADTERAQAIAGVMGGADSEIGDGTTRVLLESAHFQPALVRRTSRGLGLRTEASTRFERGVDQAAPPAGIARACELLVAIGAGEPVGPLIDCHPVPAPVREVGLRRARIPRLLGFDVASAEVDRILTRLGFVLEPAPEGWRVRVPSARMDVSREVDLIEEVGRHAGFDRVPETFPALGRLEAGLDPRIRWERLARRVLTGAGFFEAMTFAFVEQAAAEPFLQASPGGLVAVANPLSEKFAVLRPSLLPGLVDVVAYNRHRERRDVRVFETGHVFSTSGETRRVAFVWTGAAVAAHWSGGAREVDFYDASGLAVTLCRAFGAEVAVEPAGAPYLVAGRTAAIRLVGGPLIGLLGQLRPAVAAARDLAAGDAVYAAELDLEPLGRALEAQAGLRVQPLPRHPSVVRDLSVVVDDTLPAAAVRGTIRQAAPPTLADAHEFDRYRGAGVPAGRVSLSFRLTFRDPDRTLTDGEVQDAMARILAALAAAHGAVQR